MDKTQSSQRSVTEPDDVKQKFKDLKIEEDTAGFNSKVSEEDLTKSSQQEKVERNV